MSPSPSPLVEWICSWKEDATFWLHTLLLAAWLALLGAAGLALAEVVSIMGGYGYLTEYTFHLAYVLSWLAAVLSYIPKGAFQARTPLSSFAVRFIMVAIPVGVGWYFVKHGVPGVFWMAIAISSFAVAYNIMYTRSRAT